MCNHQKAISAVKAARETAEQLRVFMTPEGILGNEDANDMLDTFVRVVQEIAQAHFEAVDASLEGDLLALGGGTVNAAIVDDLTDRHLEEALAAQLAAFALGIAWGRLDGRGVR